MRRTDETITARAIRTRSLCHVADVLSDLQYPPKDTARIAGYRGCLGVPMVRDKQVVGAIFVARRRPGLFSDTQVQLLKTFADQAVIASLIGRHSICGQCCRLLWSQLLDSVMPIRRTLFVRKMGSSIPPRPTAILPSFWII
jgi:hypothetical protein